MGLLFSFSRPVYRNIDKNIFYYGETISQGGRRFNLHNMKISNLKILSKDLDIQISNKINKKELIRKIKRKIKK
jgi:hypothetical protein